MQQTELAVIGVGPAGMAAAVAAAQAGVKVSLMDEAQHPGGQFLKGFSSLRAANHISKSKRRAVRLLDDLKEQIRGASVDLLPGTLVWDIDGRRLSLHGPDGYQVLHAKTIVVASGGREFTLPFPGWTLPGVITLGAAQILVKEHAVLPGKRILLCGSGPLMFAVAHELSQRGAKPIALLQATHLAEWLRMARLVWGNGERLSEGWTYLRSCFRSKTPILFGRTVTQALGNGRLEAVVVSYLDRQGHPIAQNAQTIEVDCLCLGFGFVPNIKLTQLAGCLHHYDATLGGWAPIIDDKMRTTSPWVFAAGEVSGIGGASAAMIEGRIAGLAAAKQLGYLEETELCRSLVDLRRSLRPVKRFTGMLNVLSYPPAALDAIVSDDTIICRCEDITAGQVRAAVEQGVYYLDALKTSTHVGQGSCQGRICGPIIARLMANLSNQSPAEFSPFSPRPPIKPIPLGSLVDAEGR
jgi:NADPH-dependent 2,4-dienoyl-CoA reductase/sulfur reductase-like enzyme/bacterioferritin-associated ferredoxin